MRRLDTWFGLTTALGGSSPVHGFSCSPTDTRIIRDTLSQCAPQRECLHVFWGHATDKPAQ